MGFSVYFPSQGPLPLKRALPVRGALGEALGMGAGQEASLTASQSPPPLIIPAPMSPLLSVLGGGIQKGHLGPVASIQAVSRFQVPHPSGVASSSSSLLAGQRAGTALGEGCYAGSSGNRMFRILAFTLFNRNGKRPFSKQLVGAEIPTESNASV